MSNPDQNLKINQKIEIEIPDGPYQGSYNSKVSDITEEEIKVMAIYERERLVPVSKGQEVNLLYEGDSAFYSLTTKILERMKDPIPSLVLKNTDQIERIQRRSYFRLKVNKDINYYVIKEHKDEKGQPDFKKTTAIDLSGGGLKMVLNEDLKINDRLLFDLQIDELDKLIEGKIVRIKYNTDGYSKTAGVEFVDMGRKDTDKIISYLFNYQRKLRRRGMI